MVPVWELFAVNAFEELEPILRPEEDQLSFLQRDAGYAVPAHTQRPPLLTTSLPSFLIFSHTSPLRQTEGPSSQKSLTIRQFSRIIAM